MNATHTALAMIGMTAEDMERCDFCKRSGRKAGKALRSMGYYPQTFRTWSGGRAKRWIKNGSQKPLIHDEAPAFRVLVAAVGSLGNCVEEAK